MLLVRFVAIVAAIGVTFAAVAADRNALLAQNAERANMGGLGELLDRSTKRAPRPAAQANPEKANARQLDAGPAEGRGPTGHGYLGLLCAEMETKGRGVRVSRVTPGSPADQAGLKPSDVITGVGGVRVRQLVDLASILRETRPGVTLTFDVQRGKDRKRIDVTFGRKPDEPANPANDKEMPADKAAAAGAEDRAADRPAARAAHRPAAKPAARAADRPAARAGARPAARILDDNEKPQPAAPQDEQERARAAAKRAERLGVAPPSDKNAADVPRGRTDRDWDALLKRIERLERRLEQLERAKTAPP